MNSEELERYREYRSGNPYKKYIHADPWTGEIYGERLAPVCVNCGQDLPLPPPQSESGIARRVVVEKLCCQRCGYRQSEDPWMEPSETILTEEDLRYKKRDDPKF